MTPAGSAVDAVVVVDVQLALFEGAHALPDAATLVAAVECLLCAARTTGAPVVFLQNDGPAGAPDARGAVGWDLAVRPAPDDTVLAKTADDGFADTGLDTVLQDLGVTRIAICGALSEMCVAATARAALEHGYGVVLPHDAHATYDVPAGPGSTGVPAGLASRAAEWSLGDTVEIVATADEVRFA